MKLLDVLERLPDSKAVQMQGKYWVTPAVAIRMLLSTPKGRGYLDSPATIGKHSGFQLIVVAGPAPDIDMDRFQVQDASTVCMQGVGR